MMLPCDKMLKQDDRESSGDLVSQDSLSVGSTMAKGAALMKEEDADFLARGVRDSCSTENTPVFAPMKATSPEDFSLIASSSLLGDESGSCRRLSDIREAAPEREDFFSMKNAQQFNQGTLQQYSGAGDESTEVVLGHRQDECMATPLRDRLLLKRCLSGDVVVPRAAIGTNAENADTVPLARDDVASLKSFTEEICPSNPNDATEEAKSSEYMVRSKSYDRRLHEAAQFAEAVGEMPPCKGSQVQVIIEEIESDYDDSDSEVDVVVDASSTGADEAPFTSLSKRVSFCDPSTVSEQRVPDSHPQDVLLLSPLTHRRQKSRPRWPFTSTPQHSDTILHTLPPLDTQRFVYKGICSNPPEITKRGISRGNYAQLHRKAWLEVSDKYHRYGKNLRLYYREWESLGFPTNQFFDWLDSKGEAAGQPLPNLEECPRSQLDADTVHYITNPEVTAGYALSIVTTEERKALVLDVDGDPVQTGPEGWIFVLRDNTLYGAEKITSVSGHSVQRFHHSSFFGGKAVAAAGILITNENGILTRVYAHSGHYRPGEADMQRMLFHLHDKGVDLRSFDMDTQQMLHVARTDLPTSTAAAAGAPPEKKKKKTQSLHLKPAVYVACFLAHKARFIGEGIFDQIHTIRKAHVTSVAEALDECDGGGFWAKVRREYKERLNNQQMLLAGPPELV